MTLTVGLLAAGAFTGGVRAAAAAPAALPTGLVHLQNLVTGNQPAADGSGRTVMVNPPQGGEDHQQWRLETTGSGNVQIKNSDWPTLCLGRRGTSDLTTLRDCGADTEWRFTPLAGDRYRITEPAAGVHLADLGSAFALAPGAGNEATWFVTPIAPATSPAAVTALNRYAHRGETPGHGVPTRPQWRVPRLAVMPLGDSITQGVGSSTGNGYRAELREALHRHATTVDFVGSLRHGTHADAEHEGHSGFRIDQIAAGIGPWLLAARPNVVTLHLGSNDINRDYHVAGAPARLAELIDQILTAAPDVTVLVAPIVPNSRAGAQPRVDAFNRALPRIVGERRLKGHKVRLVDFGALDNADLADGLHPNDSGYQKMADAFYAGLTGAAQENLITENVPVHPVPPT
ncbi:GDSL-type esterase/lipase family protein [Streptomyces sp. NPDC127068]|uniref:GDSL-type esterase/lipase family protein n=1 Tax=Streptomyces sp. NPDC127068 TaxID=3347127 RepID=UPI00365C5C4C